MKIIPQRGLTLVEILVAMVISLFLLGGVIQVYSSNRSTYGYSEALSRIQENARFAMTTIMRDLRMAGFRGCATDDYVNNLNVNSEAYSSSLHDFFSEPPIEGINENQGLNGSDTVIVRGPAPGQANIVPPFNSPTSAQIFANVNGFLEVGDIVLLSNCRGADVFQVTNITQGSGAAKLSVVHNTGAVASGPGNYNPGSCGGGNAHCLSQTYGGDSAIMKMQTVQYDIAAGEGGEPALYRSVFTDRYELVDGIEQMQILYGINTDTNDSTPNRYVTSDQVADWATVTAVRVMLLARSPDTVSMGGTAQTYRFNGVNYTVTDGRLRQVFSSTIALRNRLNQ
jgi:type IV pilus assembly protein PilW